MKRKLQKISKHEFFEIENTISGLVVVFFSFNFIIFFEVYWKHLSNKQIVLF